MNQEVEPKSKAVAIVLWLFIGWLSWTYTYKVDLQKIRFFLITFIIGIITILIFKPEDSLFTEVFTTAALIWLAAAWLWPLFDLFTRSIDWYENYPNGDPNDQSN